MYSESSSIKIFSCNSNLELSEKICKELGVPLGVSQTSQFSDGEIAVDIFETVRGADTYIIQSTSAPVNDHLMELLIMIDAFKRASAGRINAVIPYYGYARQDRKMKARDPITSKLVADILTTAGADRVVCLDLHASQLQGYFNIPVDHMKATPILAKHIKTNYNLENAVIVSPDIGGVRRARNFGAILDLPIAIIEKRRPKANVSEVMNVIGDIEGKDAILVDDIIDTAGSITKAAAALIELGAKSVIACCTHSVLSGPAIRRLEESVIEKLIITDSIKLPEEKIFSKIEIVSVAPLLAEAITRIHGNKSVSTLFD